MSDRRELELTDMRVESLIVAMSSVSLFQDDGKLLSGGSLNLPSSSRLAPCRGPES